MIKICKKGFTLAETIMTLFIVGLVVTAAIPVFTRHQMTSSELESYCANNANAEICKNRISTDSPWTSCNTEQNSGLCTSYPVVVPAGKVPFKSYADVTFDFTFYPENEYKSLYDIFFSDKRIFRVGNYYFQEYGNNLFITEQEQNNINSVKHSNNLVIGLGYDIKLFTEKFISNVFIGNNTFSGKEYVGNTIIGNDNVLADKTNYSLVFGEGNKINGLNSSLVVGSGISVTDNNVVIGKPSYALNEGHLYIGDHIIGNANGNSVTFNDDIEINGMLTVSTPMNISDERLKNVKGSYNKGLKEILQVNPIIYSFKNDITRAKNIGVIAQDLQKTFPEAVVKMPNGYLGVDTDPVFFAMLNALKEVEAKTEIEKTRQIELQNELIELKKELKSLTECKAADFWGRARCFIIDFKRLIKSFDIFHESEARYAKI